MDSAQTARPLELTVVDELRSQEAERSCLGEWLKTAGLNRHQSDFIEGVVASTIQRPQNALDHITGNNLGSLKIADDRSVSLASTAGHLVGSIGTFFILSKLTHGKVSSRLGKVGNTSLGAAADAGLTGAIHGGLLTASDENAPLIKARLQQAFLSGSTFAVMGGAGRAFEQSGPASYGFGKILCEAAAGGISGIAEAHLKAIVQQGRLADAQEMRNDAMTYAAFGAGLAGLRMVLPGALTKKATAADPASKPDHGPIEAGKVNDKQNFVHSEGNHHSRPPLKVPKRTGNVELKIAQTFEACSSSPFIGEIDARKRFPTLTERKETAVVIVGGGIGGVMVRAELAKHGIPSILLEGRRIGARTTAMMGAMITRVPDLDYAPVKEMYGKQKFHELVKLLAKGQQDVMRLAAEVPSNLQRCNSYNISYKPCDPVIIERFNLVRNADQRVSLLKGKAASAVFEPAKTALVLHGEGNLDTRKFTLSLASRGKEPVFEDSPVLSIEFPAGKKIEVQVSGGAVRADHVIFATGGATAPFSHLDHYLEPVQCFAATAKVKTGPKGNFFDNNDPDFNYFRMLGPNKLMFGGAARFLNHDKAASTAPKLKENLEWLFPGAELEQQWTGTIFTTIKDGLPILEQHYASKQVWQLTGLGGIGLVNSAMSARVFRQAVQGKLVENPLVSSRLDGH